jgi:lipoprotein signal peptidase
MKRILLISIIILTMVNLKSQLQKDKYYHAGAGVIGAGAVFTPFYLVSGDENLSFRASYIFVPMIAVSKEVYDVSNGGEFSLADAGITIGTSLLTGYCLKKIFNGRNKRKNKRDIITVQF